MKKWISKSHPHQEKKHVTLQVVLIGFVLSLSIGFLEMIEIILSSKPADFSSFLLLLPALAATVYLFFLLYIVLWFLVILPIGRFFKLDILALAHALAGFLAVSVILASLTKQLHYPHSFPEVLSVCIFLVFSFLLSTSIYFMSKAGIYSHLITLFSLALPFVLAETLGVIWLSLYRMTSFFSLTFFLIVGGYTVLVLLTVWALFSQRDRKTGIAGVMTAFMVCVGVSPLGIVVAQKVSLARLNDVEHQINNVILITDDTLRPDFLSCYNPQSASTPHIDQLAKDGILFSQAISSAPWTLPSVSSIMTGLSPLVHQTVGMTSKLPDTARTLAEYMGEAGYYTAAIGFNRFLTPRYNVRQGFQEYMFFPKSGRSLGMGLKVIHDLFSLRSQFRFDASTSDLTALTIDWLESHDQNNFFLWLHYFDPHLPYAPPPRFLSHNPPSPFIGHKFSRLKEVRGGYFVPSLAEREWIKALYTAEVRYVDENIGELLAALKRLNLYDGALIIFTSDHGEEFWDHDGFEHGHTLYNEQLWVPLIIKPPRSASHRQIRTEVPTQALMPTILDLCGIDYQDKAFSSGSFSSLWGANSDMYDEQPIISTGVLYYEDRVSVIFDGLKYVRSLLTDREELYNLAHDPGEHRSLASSSPEKLQRARALLEDYHRTSQELGKHYRIMNEEEVKLDRETLQQLKSLGYTH